jgi:hypothetical protein
MQGVANKQQVIEQTISAPSNHPAPPISESSSKARSSTDITRGSFRTVENERYKNGNSPDNWHTRDFSNRCLPLSLGRWDQPEAASVAGHITSWIDTGIGIYYNWRELLEPKGLATTLCKTLWQIPGWHLRNSPKNLPSVRDSAVRGRNLEQDISKKCSILNKFLLCAVDS